MKTFKFNIQLLIVTTVLTAVPLIGTRSFAGNADGGGGDTVLCYKSIEVRDFVEQEIRTKKDLLGEVNLQLDNLQNGFKPQLLDLYEVRKPKGFPGMAHVPILINHTADKIYAQVKTILDIDHTPKICNSKTVNAWKVFFEQNITKNDQWIGEPNGIFEIDDTNYSSHVPRNCLVVQIAFYNDVTNRVHYDSRIAVLMESVDLEALRVHEDLYRIARTNRDNVSLFDQVYLAPRRSDGTVDLDVAPLIHRRITELATSDKVRALVAKIYLMDSINQELAAEIQETLLIDLSFQCGREAGAPAFKTIAPHKRHAPLLFGD